MIWLGPYGYLLESRLIFQVFNIMDKFDFIKGWDPSGAHIHVAYDYVGSVMWF